MAVTITSPQSAVVARNSFTLAWTNTYPQASYEILYRKKGESAWSTFGKVSGTATQASVDCSSFEDFVEYQYRVICYSEYANTTELTYSGSDASAAYAVIIVPPTMVGTMKVKYGSGMIEVPLYSTTQSGSQTIHAGSGKMTKLIDTTGATSGSVSPLRIRENDVTKSAPQASKYLTDTGVTSYKNITARSSYYTTYTIPAYYAYTAAYYAYTAVSYYLKTAAYYKYTAAYNVLKTAAYYNYYTQTNHYSYNYYYYWLDSESFASYLTFGYNDSTYYKSSLYIQFYWPLYFSITQGSAYNIRYDNYVRQQWINARSHYFYVYNHLVQFSYMYQRYDNWYSGADFSIGSNNAIIVPSKSTYGYTYMYMSGTIIKDADYGWYIHTIIPYYYGTYYTGYYYDYDEDSATVYYTTKFYAYTAAVYYTVPAYYAYTAPVYSTIPAYYKYTSAYYAYTSPKYYTLIHYTYAYV